MDATYHTDEYEHPSTDVMYVVDNIPGRGCKLDDFESEFSVGCSCSQLCTSDCSCTQGTQNYIDNCLLIDKKSLIVECNNFCTCTEKCENRLVQRGPLDCLSIMKATNNIMGYGLFSTKFIKKGQFICQYAGEIIGIDEAKKRWEENKINGSMNYVLIVCEYIGEKKITTCIDPSKFGNIGRYSNHSCQPNTVLVPVRVESMVPKLCLFAVEDIEPMSEITFNYAGDVVNSNENLSETQCLCGSAVCFGYLPHWPM